MTIPDSPDLHQLFYISRSLASPAEVEEILLSARQHNQRLGITGALLFTGGHFAQLLEGPRAGLAQAMARIERDQRHADLQRLLQSPIPLRRCSQWRMALINKPGADDLIQQLLMQPAMTPDRADRLLGLLLASASEGDAAAI